MATGRESSGRWPAWCLGPALGLLALAGCENMMGRPGFDGDPITGGGAAIPRPAAGNPASPTAVAAAAGQSNPAPIPVPSSSTSPAALTGGGANPTLDSARDMRIGAGLGAPAPASSGSWQNTGSTTGAVLHTPQPATDGSFQQASVQPTPSNAAPTNAYSVASVDTYQQLQQALNSRGVAWRRLETVGDSNEWHFTCSISNPQTPGLRHNYEAKASTDLGAIRAVLDQIDHPERHP